MVPRNFLSLRQEADVLLKSTSENEWSARKGVDIEINGVFWEGYKGQCRSKQYARSFKKLTFKKKGLQVCLKAKMDESLAFKTLIFKKIVSILVWRRNRRDFCFHKAHLLFYSPFPEKIVLTYFTSIVNN